MARGNSLDAYERAHDADLMNRILVATPAQVMSFDPSSLTVDVMPMVMSSGAAAPVLGVPVATISGGGFVVRPWYQGGEAGVILYLNQDGDNAIGSGQAGAPNTSRSHSATDAVFVGTVKPAAAGPYPDDAFVLAVEGGEQYIALTKEKIEIKGDIELDGDITATGSITEGG